ncbi:VG15 protein [Adlercreutzia sp. ZJ141]|uniref:VG15 protein n=1 Tax=Adlercreutzia sp. ZJ141 TaxID=2709406 RepID=UPI0013EB200E|nr:DUF6883 domain-containing protein [Adlercreutzia sp. ZJ141]
MRLSRKALSEYDARLAKLEGAAYDHVRKRIEAYLAAFPRVSAESVREFAIEQVNDAVLTYGDGASSLAADLYDEMAESAGVTIDSAVIDTSDVSAYVEREVRYQIRKYLDGDTAGFSDACGNQASEQVGRRANQTMRINAKRDGIRYARVPMGSETCTFCIMLASRGFVYLSASAAGEGNHFHRGCRCKVVPGFSGMEVEGYDPDELYRKWKGFDKIDKMQGVSDFDKRVLKAAFVQGREPYDRVMKALDDYEITSAKLERYALSPDGDANKAKAFAGYLGYTAKDAAEVAARMYAHVAEHEPERRNTDEYGDRFTTHMTMDGKDGRSALVKAGWITDKKKGKLRLTSIYVNK